MMMEIIKVEIINKCKTMTDMWSTQDDLIVDQTLMGRAHAM
jgi:hypothetical protein